MNKQRILITTITGALLGIFCIVGANLRYEGTLSNAYLFAFWYNRVVMGFVIGLLICKGPIWKMVLRGAIIGLAIGFMFYSATEFLDLTGFMVSAIYGVIIEFVAYFIENKKEKNKEGVSL